MDDATGVISLPCDLTPKIDADRKGAADRARRIKSVHRAVRGTPEAMRHAVLARRPTRDDAQRIDAVRAGTIECAVCGRR